MKKVLIILLILVMSISLFSCSLFGGKDPVKPVDPVDPVDDPTNPDEEPTIDPLNAYYKEEYRVLVEQFSLYYQKCENAGLENALDNNSVYIQYMDEIYSNFQKQYTYDENNNVLDYYSKYISLKNFYAELDVFVNDPVTYINEYNKQENGEYESDIVIETYGLWPSGNEYFFNKYIPQMSSVSKFTLVYHKDNFYSYEIQVPNITSEDFDNYKTQLIQNLAIHFDKIPEYNVYYATYSDHDIDITLNIQLNESIMTISVANFIYD